jgi:AraC-like DNA-binding protein
MSGFWTLVFAVGAAQGVFLCGALVLRKAGNRSSTRLLAGLAAVATTMIVAGALGGALPARFAYLVSFLNINSELAIGPLLLLFARSLVDPTRRLHRRDGVHFLALVAGMALWAVTWVVLGDADRRIALLANGLVVPVYMAFKVGWLLCYLVAAYRTLDDARLAGVHAGGRRRVPLGWLRHALLALGAMAAAIYAVSFAQRFGVEMPFEADPLGSLVLAALLYLVSLMVLQRPWVLALRPRPDADDRSADEAARLTAYLESGKPWLRPDLTLADLAETLGSTENRLSTAIRDGLDTSFYALLNRYRLAEFERLAGDPALEHRSVLELAYEAGFNSKAAFYRAFRDTYQMTPTAFRAAT